MIAACVFLKGNPTGGSNPGAPVSSFTANPGFNVFLGARVAFTDTSTNNPTAWSWTVNGNVFSNLQNPTYYPPTTGVFVIGLTASNGYGTGTPAYHVLTVNNNA